MYVALKDLNLSGVRYMIGEMVPEEAVVPNRAAALIRSGYIAKHEDKNGDGTDIANAKSISVHLQKSGKDIILYPDEAEAVFTILQESTGAAASLLAQQTSQNVLKVIRELDGRKGVREAASGLLNELDQ